MAQQDDDILDQGAKLANDTAKAAGSVNNALEAAAHAGAGNVTGAIRTVLKDENFRKAIIAIILVGALVITACAMMIGTAITGSVEYLTSSLSENWADAWESAGVESGGNTIYLYTIGALDAGVTAVVTTFQGFFTGDANSEISNAGIDNSTMLTNDDYDNTLKSIFDEEALTGENGALASRLEMIKNRIKQRGSQLKTQVLAQYALESVGLSIAETLQALTTDPFLFSGIGDVTVSIDTSAFDITDVQALKIMAAYSIQHDCLLAEVDMWDLMEYCGWYDVDFTSLDTSALGEYSIYNSTANGRFDDEIAGVVAEGESLRSYYTLSAPRVTAWKGSFTPQWYNEELAALIANNKLYDVYSKNGNTEKLEGMIRYAENADGTIDVSNFEKLGSVVTFGLVDKIYTATTASLTVTRSDYEGAGEKLSEALASSIAWLKQAWNKAEPYIGARTGKTPNGNIYNRSKDSKHSFSLTTTENGCAYYLVDENGTQTNTKVCNADNQVLTWTGLSAETTYYVYQEKNTTYTYEEEEETEATNPPNSGSSNSGGNKEEEEEEEKEDSGNSDSGSTTKPTKPQLPGSGGSGDDNTPSILLGNIIKEPEDVVASESGYSLVLLATRVETVTETTKIDQFKTFVDTIDYQAYELNLYMTVTFSSISVDQLLMNLMGLWPGSLMDTNIYEVDGLEYASGYEGNELLLKSWTDTYTDPVTGKTAEIEFSRTQSYQVEAYKDLIQAMGAMLGINVSGLYSNSGGGGTIVEVARAELEYYVENGLSGGMRYWNMAREAGGTTITTNEPWCVCFILSCANICGYIGEDALWGNMNNGEWILYCSGIYNYLVNGGYADGYTGNSDYMPIPGDLILFGGTVSTANLQHIGLVVDVADDGTVTYINGNCGGGPGYLKASTASNYKIGSYAYEGAVISAYCSPYYPVSYISKPLYLSVAANSSNGFNLQPSGLSRTVNVNGYAFNMTGTGRFRNSQLQDVVTALKEDYPELYNPDLQTALDNEDFNAFMHTWNRIMGSGKSQSFEYAQNEILTTLVSDPIAKSVRTETGFNWIRTEFRENLLLGIVSTSDQTRALEKVLAALCTDMTNNTSDSDFLDVLSAVNGENIFLYDVLDSFRDDLWPDEPVILQDAWIETIVDLLAELVTLYNETAAALGDSSSSVEKQIFYYLTNTMGLPVSSACGILANIQHESSFNPNAIGDYGTSYGLCQWHNERYDALISYCNANGYDYRTVLGQMKYLQYELETNYASMLSKLRGMANTASGAYDAGYLWCVAFERPANAESKGYSRGTLAKNTYWPKYSS